MKTKRGFTLVEIMIVVAILGLLIAIGVPGFLQARNRSQFRAETANLKSLVDGIAVYQTAYDGNPPTAIGLLWPASATDVDQNSFVRKQMTCPKTKGAYTVSTADAKGSCATHGMDPTQASFNAAP